jgi:metal transporter CNNM
MSKPVLLLMYLMAPLAWPTAKLLDRLLGEDHGTVYKKSGLKTLVTLHKSLGDVSQRLNQDEVTIISAVLDLKEKPVANVMTPMNDVFIMSEDTVLDEDTMDMILSAGYSRIPIHETGSPMNFVGMLLVKILITYDPEDGKLVREFPLATLPETRPETSCLDIVNFFQEGKSHMVLVSEFPGEDHGALGVVTLEDVIEELIGECVLPLAKCCGGPTEDAIANSGHREIIDESDVYIDVHKAIRRLTPAPKARLQRHLSLSEDHAAKLADDSTVVADSSSVTDGNSTHRTIDLLGTTGHDAHVPSSSPKTTTFMMRRSSAGADGQTVRQTIPVRANLGDIKQHLRHLGPSNPATNPRDTKSTTVKIKPGHPLPVRANSVTEGVTTATRGGDETTRLLTPQVTAKDGIQALQQSYGSLSPAPAVTVQLRQGDDMPTLSLAPSASKATQTPDKAAQSDTAVNRSTSSGSSARSSKSDGNAPKKRGNVRSGSITENIVESRGVRKVILETTSSNEDDEFALLTSTSPEAKRAGTRSTSVLSHDGVMEEPEEEDEEDALLSPGGGPSGGSKGNAGGQAGESSGGGGKKKTRRKKRKDGKS